ncbi:MAG: hypothetical protein AAFX32_04010 [Pseudomonadota bacterium]
MTWNSKEFTMNVFSALIILALLVPIWSAISTHGSFARIQAVKSGELDVLEHAQRLSQKPQVQVSEEWVATARELYSEIPEQSALATSLLERALVETPGDYESWAYLAFLKRQEPTGFTPEIDADLQRSFEACPYCKKSLLRWRFTFVLANWEATSEQTRLYAFSGADFLRWWHLDYDYLEEVRLAAIARGIPFDEYRRKIDTPARPNEIGLSTD